MALGFGSGFLPTDPRKKKLPKGGSIQASQYKDTSVLQSGKMGDSIGYASPTATATAPGRPPIGPQQLTQEEKSAGLVKAGVATTHENMGDLAVQYRADADAARASGGLSIDDKRALKVIDTRAANEYKYNVTDPAQSALGASRAQGAARAAYLDQYSYDNDTSSKGLFDTVKQKTRGVGSALRIQNTQGSGINRYQDQADTAKQQWAGDVRSGNVTGAYGQPWTGGPGGPRSTNQNVRSNSSSANTRYLPALMAHSSAPYQSTQGTRRVSDRPIRPASG